MAPAPVEIVTAVILLLRPAVVNRFAVQAAAIFLPVEPILAGQLDAALVALALFEVRRQPAHAVLLRKLGADGVEALRVLVRRDGERRAEIVEPVRPCLPRRLLETQTEAYRAARAALRLTLEAADGVDVALPVIIAREQRHRLRRREAANELLLPVETAVIFRARLDVRIVVQHGHAKIPREVLEHVAAARTAAAVQQQARLFLRRERGEQRIELFLIVFFHKRHPPVSIAHTRTECQRSS